MRIIQKETSLPLVAPRIIPITQSEGDLFLAAQTVVSQMGYHVHLQLTETPLSVNNPAINDPLNTAMANNFGGFGVTQYPRSGTVKMAVAKLAYSPKAGTIGSRINLGSGVTGQVFGESGIVRWAKGHWTFDVMGVSRIDQSEARKIVEYLAGQRFPATDGVMTVQAAGDGNHTVIEFQAGDILYQVSDYHSAIGAIEMAMGMKSWPTSQNLHVESGEPNPSL